MKLFKRLTHKRHFTKQEAFGALLVATLFLLALFASYQYSEEIKSLVVLGGPLGMLLYLALAVASVVLAPMAALPFLPIAVELWGSLATALLSISGWTLGGVVAFLLARKYGRPFVAKILSLERAEKIATRIAGKHTFWAVLLSRVILPTDITSYAIGLFVPIRLLPYTVATLLGSMPIAFALSYGVALPVLYQVGVAVSVLVLVVAVYFVAHHLKRKQ